MNPIPMLLRLCTALIALTTVVSHAFPARQDEPLVILPESWLVLRATDDYGRRPFQTDAAFALHLLEPGAKAPVAGAALEGELEGEEVWEAVQDVDGWPDVQLEKGQQLGYAYTSIELEVAKVMIARMKGSPTLWVNGAAYAGDIYKYGFGGVPVELRAGRNDFYVSGVRSVNLQLVECTQGLRLCDWDLTRPHVVAGEPVDALVGVLLQNCSTEATGSFTLRWGGTGVVASGSLAITAGLPPLGVLKVALHLQARGDQVVAKTANDVAVTVRAMRNDFELARVPFILGVREAGQRRLHTYLSGVDGSVQEFGLMAPEEPAEPGAPDADEDPMRLALSLHGAGVDCWGQLNSYAPKPDFWLVAPTNRRKFGFDWQDWGRRDAYDVLDQALRISGVDRRHVYLTGHSMGGHGTWHLAANDPDGFAACAPSAGWATFDSYSGRPQGERAAEWHAADGASLTFDLLGNLAQVPTFILHGTRDSNVLVKEALTMAEKLAGVGASITMRLEGGAGHWWGKRCVDYPAIFEHFRKNELPEDPEKIDFTTVDPGVDAQHYWVRIEQLSTYGEQARVKGELNSETGKISLLTSNVRSLALALVFEGVDIEIDGVDFEWKHFPRGAREQWFLYDGATWSMASGSPGAGEKRATSCGPFKRAFDREFILVYGTVGTAHETRELLGRARFDSQVWWYRGNGRARVWSDAEFLGRDQALHGSSNVILYGNRDSNAAWTALMPKDAPIDVWRGGLRVREREYAGHDRVAAFVLARGDDAAIAGSLVAAFGDTGLLGTRLGYDFMHFMSGVGMPDYLIIGPEVLKEGDAAVVAAGWWNHIWR